jgi:hypothetical protein
MPKYDDIGLNRPFSTAGISAYFPVILKSASINLASLTVSAATNTDDFTVIDIPTGMQPFVSMWALTRVTLTALGDVTAFDFSVGTVAPYDDLMAVYTEVGPTITNGVYGLPDTQQGTDHFLQAGTTEVNRLSGIGLVNPSAVPWSSNTVKLRITNTATGTGVPTGSARVYLVGFEL